MQNLYSIYNQTRCQSKTYLSAHIIVVAINFGLHIIALLSCIDEHLGELYPEFDVVRTTLPLPHVGRFLVLPLIFLGVAAAVDEFALTAGFRHRYDYPCRGNGVGESGFSVTWKKNGMSNVLQINITDIQSHPKSQVTEYIYITCDFWWISQCILYKL